MNFFFELILYQSTKLTDKTVVTRCIIASEMICAIFTVWWHNNLEQWVQTKYICVAIWSIIFPKTWHRSKSSTAFWHEEQILQFYLWQEMEDLTMFHLLFVWLELLQFLLQRTPFPSAWNLLNRSWTVLLKIRSVWNIICCLNKKLPEDPVDSLWQRLVRVSWCTLVSYYFPTLFFCPPMVSC